MSGVLSTSFILSLLFLYVLSENSSLLSASPEPVKQEIQINLISFGCFSVCDLNQMEGVKEQAALEQVNNQQELSVAANSGDCKEILHPLTTGFRAASMATSGANATIPKPDQLTIFYGGNVLVFDAFPLDKAREIMLIAAAVVKPADMKPAAAVSPANSTSALPSPKGPTCPISQGFSLCKLQEELPITRKHSLQRFFEKRRDRLSNKNPYSAPAAKISTSKIPDFRAEVSKDGGCTMQDKVIHPEVAANVA